MLSQLSRRRTLDNALRQLLQQPIRARNRLRALTTGEQQINQLVRDLLRGHDPPLRIMHTQNPGRSPAKIVGRERLTLLTEPRASTIRSAPARSLPDARSLCPYL